MKSQQARSACVLFEREEGKKDGGLCCVQMRAVNTKHVGEENGRAKEGLRAPRREFRVETARFHAPTGKEIVRRRRGRKEDGIRAGTKSDKRTALPTDRHPRWRFPSAHVSFRGRLTGWRAVFMRFWNLSIFRVPISFFAM